MQNIEKFRRQIFPLPPLKFSSWFKFALFQIQIIGAIQSHHLRLYSQKNALSQFIAIIFSSSLQQCKLQSPLQQHINFWEKYEHTFPSITPIKILFMAQVRIISNPSHPYNSILAFQWVPKNSVSWYLTVYLSSSLQQSKL